jgi:hypothetical protein
MAAVLKVGKAQWTKMGLPGTDYDTILNKGYKPVWSGNAWRFADAVSGDMHGTCQYSAQNGLTPDKAFIEKYKQLTGTIMTIDTSAPEAVAAQQPTSTIKPKKADVMANGGTPRLCDATEVGITVKGTESAYTCYMVSDDLNVAYRLTGSKLSIRAEAFTPAAQAALTEWGLSCNKASDGRPYASAHVGINGGDKALAAKTLGSFVASCLTGAPKAIQSAKAVK